MQRKHAKVELWVLDVKKNIFHLFCTHTAWGLILISEIYFTIWKCPNLNTEETTESAFWNF